MSVTFPEMSVDAHIAGRPSKTLVLPVGDVLISLRVDVLLSQTKVDDMDNVIPLRRLTSNEKVLRLHVSVDQVFAVRVFHTRNLNTENSAR